MIKFKPHHKLAFALVALAILLFVSSFALPSVSSYLIVAGIALLLLGLLMIDPSWIPF